jgi:Glycosyltransferase family 87
VSRLLSAAAPAVGAQGLGIRKLVSSAICIGFGLAFVLSNIVSWDLEDMDAYWNAAVRLRDGLPLYPSVPEPGAADVFRYSPWFAWLWVPLTSLPKAAVQIGWSALLVSSIPVALGPLVRHRSAAAICLAALTGGLLVRTASTGNVHALLIGLLVGAAGRRSGALWIAVAASLKFAPIAYALVHAGRREWGRAATTILLTAALVAPVLLYDLSGYPTDASGSFSLWSVAGPAPFIALAALASVAAFGLARTRLAWVAASVAVLALTPRLELYGLTYLLVGLSAMPWGTSDRA